MFLHFSVFKIAVKNMEVFESLREFFLVFLHNDDLFLNALIISFKDKDEEDEEEQPDEEEHKGKNVESGQRGSKDSGGLDKLKHGRDTWTESDTKSRESDQVS